ncbi:hypothetical protein, partial [Pontibacterium sp.]|uniref:hypothetical protein n=1 Tax=Pontibacterium sp. TaxID=2036026 RepID=UPI003568EEE5
DKTKGPKPALVTVEDDAAQSRYIIDKVLFEREAGTALRDQAVLFRAQITAIQLIINRCIFLGGAGGALVLNFLYTPSLATGQFTFCHERRVDHLCVRFSLPFRPDPLFDLLLGVAKALS